MISHHTKTQALGHLFVKSNRVAAKLSAQREHATPVLAQMKPLEQMQSFDRVTFSGAVKPPPQTETDKPLLGERFQEALLLANKLHSKQIRKTNDPTTRALVPYMSHLMAVASIVLEHGGTEDEAIAALLHDAVEDQGGQPTLALIRQQFGDVVADIVSGCTDADVIPKPPWQERKAAYIAHVATASASVRLVSASDKLHNARSIVSDLYNIGETVWDKFKGGKTGTLWYYRSLVTAFKAHGDSNLLRELDRAVTQMEKLANPAAQ